MSGQPICNTCHVTMTPENSRIHPEYFLCDKCLPDDLRPAPPEKGAAHYRRLRAELNRIHTELQQAPAEHHAAYSLDPGSILNAYREGDCGWQEAKRLLALAPPELQNCPDCGNPTDPGTSCVTCAMASMEAVRPAAVAPTIRVRIAVAVGENRQWAASGWLADRGKVSDEMMSEYAVDALDCAGPAVVHFVECDLAPPESQTVEGQVEP